VNASASWFILLAVVTTAAITVTASLRTSKESAACNANASSTEVASPQRLKHEVVINHPAGSPRVATGKVDGLGREITLSCASCHANRASNLEVGQGKELQAFHQGLHFAHGKLKCVSCHNPDDYNSLHLAEGRSLSFTNVQRLCAQCHASQANDYDHGVHGGMSGHWDLSRGPRQRKGCIDCHDPHAPAFPEMVPTFKSRDRFLDPSHEGKPHE
jgi:hypothetical protein